MEFGLFTNKGGFIHNIWTKHGEVRFHKARDFGVGTQFSDNHFLMKNSGSNVQIVLRLCVVLEEKCTSFPSNFTKNIQQCITPSI